VRSSFPSEDGTNSFTARPQPYKVTLPLKANSQPARRETPLVSLHLNSLDYGIVIAYFLVILLIGLALRRRNNTSRQFFEAGRSLPLAITGIAFVAANSGSLEVMGMISTSAKYGWRAMHFYWIGAVPAMLFLALWMMPIYYRSQVRSVPEFLKVRFGEPTRVFNALSFAVLTVLVSGVGLYAMALILQVIFAWTFLASTLISAVFVLAYILLGGLRATMYNEVLQFGLIVAGFAPLAWVSVRAVSKPHVWAGMHAIAPQAPALDGLGVLFGLGFVLSFGYWCTDFVLIQRGLAARDLATASATPLVAAAIKLVFPLLVVVPGVAAAAILPSDLSGRFDLALPALLAHYYPHGLLGLGVTAVLASFMSGMAGNISAFNTVWTYDLYQAHLAKDRSDAHYLLVGRIATVVATLLSIGTSFVVLRFNNLMDYVQMLFSVFNAPLFATFLLGMFTRWATPAGGLTGLIFGTLASFGHWLLYHYHVLHYGSDMTASFYGAGVGWVTCLLVTIAVSAVTKNPEALVSVADGGASGDRKRLPRGLLFAAITILFLLVMLNLFFA
jgi:solute:Na+ symporter, SSS family